MMKRKELLYILATLLLLFILGVSYLTLNKRSRAVSTTKPSTAVVKLSSQLEKMLTDLENNPSKEALALAQAEADKLTNKTQKDSVQNRLNKVKAKLNLVDSTEKAVQNAEANPSERTIKAAQDAINRVTIASKKEDFQKRLDKVKEALTTGNTTASPNQDTETSQAASSSDTNADTANPAAADTTDNDTDTATATYTPAYSNNTGGGNSSYVTPTSPSRASTSTPVTTPSTTEIVEQPATTGDAISSGETTITENPVGETPAPVTDAGSGSE